METELYRLNEKIDHLRLSFLRIIYLVSAIAVAIGIAAAILYIQSNQLARNIEINKSDVIVLRDSINSLKSDYNKLSQDINDARVTIENVRRLERRVNSIGSQINDATSAGIRSIERTANVKIQSVNRVRDESFPNNIIVRYLRPENKNTPPAGWTFIDIDREPNKVLKDVYNKADLDIINTDSYRVQWMKKIHSAGQ